MSGEDTNKANNAVVLNINALSLLIMCSAYHPGNFISSIISNGENYANWGRIVTNALRSKNKFCFVNGLVHRPGSQILQLYFYTCFLNKHQWGDREK